MDRTTFAIAAAAVLAMAYVLAMRAGQGADPTDTGGAGSDIFPSWPVEPDQTTSLLEDVAVSVNPSTYTPANVSAEVADTNVYAFLAMIAWSEGTDGPDGYRTLFGGGLFDSYADHPRVYVPFRNTSSSAAGRYQILARTYDSLRGKLGLVDFSPAAQDACAIELIRERGALNDVRAGRVATAIKKCAPVWASLPGAGYSQPERQLSALLGAYARAGGQTETTA